VINLVEWTERPPRELLERSTYPDILERYWRSIRTCHVTGSRVQDRYNYRWIDDAPWSDWEHRLTQEVFEPLTQQVKINASYGYVLRNVVSDDLRYYHSCQNNTRLLDESFHIADPASFRHFLDAIHQRDVLEWARQQRPDSQWVVEAVTNITIFVNKLRGHPMGFHTSRLPPYLRYNRGLLSLYRTNETGAVSFANNLCLFRCLACHMVREEFRGTSA